MGGVKGRVWGGKNMVLEAASELVAGWGGELTQDSLQIYVSEEGRDLFEGDCYFEGEEEEVGGEAVEEVRGGGVGAGEEEEEEAVEEVEAVGSAKTRINLLGVCRLLYEQSMTKSTSSWALAYKISALGCLVKIVNAHKGGEFLYKKMASMVKLAEEEEEKVVAVILAKRIGVLGSVVHEGMGREAVEELLARVNKFAKHEAWTVRESVCSLLARVGALGTLRREAVGVLAVTFEECVQDRKYSKCRLAAYKVVRELCKRAEGDRGIMELVVVYKEQWMAVVRKKGLQDNDTDCTQVASELVVLLGRWV